MRDEPYHVEIITIEPALNDGKPVKVQTFHVKMLVEKQWLTSNVMLPHTIVEIQDATEDLEGKVFKFIMRDVPLGRKYRIDTSTKLESKIRVEKIKKLDLSGQ